MWTDGDKKEQLLKINMPEYYGNISEDKLKMIKECPNITREEISEINRRFTPYIFYKRTSSGRYTCFCTSCNGEFKISNDGYIKHNEDHICPICGRRGTAQSAGYSMKGLSDARYIVILKKGQNATYAICIKVYKSYNGDPFNKFANVCWRNDEFSRMPDLIAIYENLYVWQCGSATKYSVHNIYVRGHFVEGMTEVKNPISSAFPRSIGYGWTYKTIDPIILNEDILDEDGSLFKYSAYKLNEIFDEVAYLSAYAMYPIMEMIMKAGLIAYAKDLIFHNKKNVRLVNWKGRNPKEFFKKLDGQEIRLIMKNHVPPEILQVYLDYKKAGMKKDLEYCKAYYEINNMRDYRNYNSHIGKISFEKFDDIYKYLKRQMKICKFKTISSGYTFYKDYMYYAKQLNYNMSAQGTEFPRNLQEAHDNAVAAWNCIQEQKRIEQRLKDEKEKIRKAQEMNEGYASRYKKLCRLYSKFSYPDLVLVVPVKIEDIIAEGAALEHCVGGYAANHCLGKKTILFIRKADEPDKPYYTIEVGERDKEKYIVQCHGYKNEREYKDGKLVSWEKPDIIKGFEQAFEIFLKDPKAYSENMKKAEAV